MTPDTTHFPFSAITGQPLFKLALQLTAVNPAIGGVLISGPRGSAKSTLARALADLLPESARFVNLPLGTSEEMLIGSLDLQKALDKQKITFNEGLLAKAHGGILYVDEVNLLPDALVDSLLDVATSRVNIIERDGISHQHPADFILIGTMNPDEGELRPQLQDRFGLCVELNNDYSIAERIEIVEHREAFDQDPKGFTEQYASQQQSLSSRIQQARQLLHNMTCPNALRVEIAERCHQAHVDGMRADLVWYRAAMAHAAWHERSVIKIEDIEAVEELVLAHRRHESTPPAPPPQQPPPFSRPPESKPEQSKEQEQEQEGDWGQLPPENQRSEQVSTLPIQFPTHSPATSQSHKTKAGRNKGKQAAGHRHHKNAPDTQRINWFATLKHNIQHSISQQDWQWKYQKNKTGKAVLHLILLDTSASVLTQQGFGKAKGIIMQIAEQAYLAREKIMILGFGNQQVDTLLPQVRAPKHIQALLDSIKAAGGTPLQQALQQAQSLLTQQHRQQPSLHTQTYLLSDGRIAALPSTTQSLGECIFIDTEQTEVKRGRGKALADCLNARYFSLARGDYA